MHHLDDLRRAMMAETADLAPQRTVEEITHAGRRRVVRRRFGIIAVACAAALAIAAPITLRPDDGAVPRVAADPPGLIATGVPTDNGEELLVWPVDGPDQNGVRAGRRDPKTGQVAEILPPRMPFAVQRDKPLKMAYNSVLLPGPADTFILVGGFEGYDEVAGVTATVTGAAPRDVRFARPRHPPRTGPPSLLYWLTDIPAGARISVNAYDGTGRVVYSDKSSVQSASTRRPPRCEADPASAPAIGDDIGTFATTSAGKKREQVVRFIRDKGAADRAGFAVGTSIGGAPPPRYDCMFAFDLPPDPGRRPGISEFTGLYDYGSDDGIIAYIDVFVGPVNRITAAYDGNPGKVQFARWTAYPELVVYWVVTADSLADESKFKVTFYDASNKVIGHR